MGRNALFIGAHPDDLEIAAGGTIAKLVDHGWNVWMMVMTDDRDKPTADVRRQEAIGAALALGVPNTRIVFLGGPDGLLSITPENVQKIRDAAQTIEPDIVFTHSMADDHQDHRATHEIVCAAIRRRPRLYFPVINHLRTSSFTPQIYVDVSRQWDRKLAALRCHGSQVRRINEDHILALCKSAVGLSGLACAESYELEMPTGSEDGLTIMASINDSSFHRLWSVLLGDRPLYMITSVPISRSMKEFNWPSHHDQTGIALFRKSMSLRWSSTGGRSVVEEVRCDNRQAEENLKSGVDVLLTGGSVSNIITRNYLNHFEGIRYVIDYTMPDYRDIRILDRVTGNRIKAEYEHDMDGGLMPKSDVGILTIMRSPYNKVSTLIGVMGVHGFGTIGCYKAICEPEVISKLLSKMTIPLSGNGYQMLVRYSVRTGETDLVDATLHEVK